MPIYHIECGGLIRYTGDSSIAALAVIQGCREENLSSGVKVYLDDAKGKKEQFYAPCSVKVEVAGIGVVWDFPSGRVPEKTILGYRKEAALRIGPARFPITLTLTPNVEGEMGLEPHIVEYHDCPVKDLGDCLSAIQYAVQIALDDPEGGDEDDEIKISLTRKQINALLDLLQGLVL